MGSMYCRSFIIRTAAGHVSCLQDWILFFVDHRPYRSDHFFDSGRHLRNACSDHVTRGGNDAVFHVFVDLIGIAWQMPAAHGLDG